MKQDNPFDIKAIILDFGDVLTAPADREANHAHREMLARRLDIPVENLWVYLFEGEPSRLWMTGQIGWTDFWSTVLEPRGITDPDEVEEFASIVFSGTDELNSEMRELLFELNGRYKLAVLSNASWTATELEGMLTNDFGLPAGFFDAVITSTSAGAVKPDREIFETVLDALKVQPQESVFTDDLASFVEAAKRIGIHAHHFASPAKFRSFLVDLGVLE